MYICICIYKDVNGGRRVFVGIWRVAFDAGVLNKSLWQVYTRKHKVKDKILY